MDLMSGSYSYSSLVSKYKNFSNPAYHLTIGGTDVTQSGKILVTELNISLSYDSASTCSFTVANAYDRAKSRFDPDILDKLAVGQKAEVDIGYGSAMSLIFVGFITEVQIDYSTAPSLSVTMMDLRKLMMESNRVRQLTVKAPSDAVKKVLEPYRKLYGQLQVQADTAAPEPFNLKQNKESDYAFVMRISKEMGKDFFVLGEDVYYQEKSKSSKSIMTLTWMGGGIISFSTNMSYQAKKFLVIGREPNSKKEIYVSRTYQSEFVKKPALTSLPPTVYASPTIDSRQKAEEWIDDAIRKEKEQGISGSLTCIGLPELVPGRFITCDRLGPPLNRSYYIKKVEHSLGSGGFTTRLELGG